MTIKNIFHLLIIFIISLDSKCAFVNTTFSAIHSFVGLLSILQYILLLVCYQFCNTLSCTFITSSNHQNLLCVAPVRVSNPAEHEKPLWKYEKNTNLPSMHDPHKLLHHLFHCHHQTHTPTYCHYIFFRDNSILCDSMWRWIRTFLCPVRKQHRYILGLKTRTWLCQLLDRCSFLSFWLPYNNIW